MTKSNGFQFKQFFIRHDRCAMKVNTDGILLGAVADVRRAKRILDLGTGSGLVAIMLAQRTYGKSLITALELEPNAFLQAVENVENSAWASSIQVIRDDVLTVDFNQKFDLIVANPPYFVDGPASRSIERDLARSATQSHLAWLLRAKDWIHERGKITLILPFTAAEKLMAQAPGLFCVEHLSVYTKPNRPPKRALLSFSLTEKPKEMRRLTIHTEADRYTEEFTALTRAFYLNM